MSLFAYVARSTGDSPPADAVQGGFDGGPSYHARGVVNGKRIPGKVGTSGSRMVGACIPYGGKENRIHDFEVLTSPCQVSYVRCSTGDLPPKDAVAGGYDGGNSYHASGIVNGKRIPGKVGVSGGKLKGACIAYGSKEHRINEFDVLVIDDKIVGVDFDVDRGKLLSSTPKVIAQEVLENYDSSTDQSMEFSYNEQVSNTSSFQHTAGVGIKVGTEFKCGYPCVAEGKISVEVNASYQYSWGASKTTSKSYNGKLPVVAKAGTAVECKAVITEAILDVPYTIRLKSGRTSSGKWRGVSTWGFHATFTERKKGYTTDLFDFWV